VAAGYSVPDLLLRQRRPFLVSRLNARASSVIVHPVAVTRGSFVSGVAERNQTSAQVTGESTMSLEQVSLASQIVAALAVVGSLIFVGMQLRQNDRTQRGNSLQSVLDGYRDRTFLPGIASANVVDIWARGMNSLDSLDANEKRQFWFIILNELLHMQAIQKLRELKMIGDVDYDAWLSYTASLVRTPGGAALWPTAKRVITPTVTAAIDAYLQKHAEGPSFIESTDGLFAIADAVFRQRAAVPGAPSS